MFSLAILSAYISILSLVFLSIVLFKYENKRSLSIGFILESIVIISSLFGLKGLAILYVLRMIAAGCFILYAVKLKKN